MLDCILDQTWREYELKHRIDLKVEHVAKQTGINRDTISRLRRGKTHRYDADVLAKLAEFFGVPEGQPVPFLIVRYVDDKDAKEKAAP